MTVVCVLADPPRPGLVLRDLVETSPLSTEEAAELYAAALRDVCAAAEASGGDLLVNYRPDDAIPDAHVPDGADAEREVREAVAPALEAPDDARFEVQVGETFAGRAGLRTERDRLADGAPPADERQVVAVLDVVVTVGEAGGPLPADEREVAVVRQVRPEVGHRAADDRVGRHLDLLDIAVAVEFGHPASDRRPLDDVVHRPRDRHPAGDGLDTQVLERRNVVGLVHPGDDPVDIEGVARELADEQVGVVAPGRRGDDLRVVGAGVGERLALGAVGVVDGEAGVPERLDHGLVPFEDEHLLAAGHQPLGERGSHATAADDEGPSGNHVERLRDVTRQPPLKHHGGEDDQEHGADERGRRGRRLRP